MDTLSSCAFLLFALIALQWLKKRSKSGLPLPPGPKGYPIIGNMLDVPSIMPWKTFQQWSKTYGSNSLILCITVDN